MEEPRARVNEQQEAQQGRLRSQPGPIRVEEGWGEHLFTM